MYLDCNILINLSAKFVTLLFTAKMKQTPKNDVCC